MKKSKGDIPIYIIDLSKPPSERYVEVATDYRQELRELTTIFDELVTVLLPFIPLIIVRFFAKLLLRRLHSKEETEEIRGICNFAGISMYLAVALNVLLDSLMGCTSGVCQVTDEQKTHSMIHFRTLDWGMDPLRKVVVELHFVQHKGGPVVARSITYVGFVGVLTGVREGLSMSLNFRPYHNRPEGWKSDFRYKTHQLLTMVGFRKPIASILRELLLEDSTEEASTPNTSIADPASHPQRRSVRLAAKSHPSSPSSAPTLSHIRRTVPRMPSTACYLTFASATAGLILEKDLCTARSRLDENFLAICNHDATIQLDPADPENPEHRGLPTGAAEDTAGFSELILSSDDRLDMVTEHWRRYVRDYGLVVDGNAADGVRSAGDTMDYVTAPPRWERVRWWLDEYPVTNEETHYSCLMDPAKGEFRWCTRYARSATEAQLDRWRSAQYDGP